MISIKRRIKIEVKPCNWLDIIGSFHGINFNNAWCGDTQTIDVYCYNNQSKKCQQKTTSMDFNGDNDSLVFNCNICDEDKNLEISLDDISYKQSSGDTYEFNITVNNQNVNGNINVTIRGQDKTTGLISKESSKIESISGLTSKNFIISIDTTNVDYFHVYADENNDVTETIETDNYVIVPFIKKKEKAYIEVGTDNSKAEQYEKE